jgi:hypothetical protein
MKVFTDDGRVLNAEFGVEVVDGKATLVLESRSGDVRNPDYHDAMHVLLLRLQKFDGIITNAIVDSTVSRRRPFDERRLKLRERRYPIRLSAERDIDDLRRAIGAAQAPVAQRPGAKGGNRHKRIRLYLDGVGNPSELEPRLAAGTQRATEIQDAVEEVERSARPQRGRARGQGRGLTAAERKVIEDRAMHVATETLTAEHWQVEDVSLSRSYDLHCTRNGQELHVEVKGTTGDGASVLLTKGEVRHVSEHAADGELFVVSKINLVRGTGGRARGGEVRRLRPWRLHDGVLEPVGFEWFLPITQSS